jgi:predicted GIY-YIG superfamily endonuclease
MTMTDGVYVVELMNGCYYVGQSSNIEKRIKLHNKGGGSIFVKKCGGIKQVLTPIIERIDDFNEWELKETLIRMHIHGINNVRGFCYSQYKM